MPKDTVERAIKRGAGGEDGENYEEVRYEGYGPGGVAIIVEALTDNRNRTASDVRAAFTKAGGNLGESNSVSFLFDRVGQVTYPAAARVGRRDVRGGGRGRRRQCRERADEHVVTCAPEALNAVRDALEQRFGAPASAKLVWRPKTLTPVEGEAAEALFKLLETLEDSDDVQNVYANFEVADDVMARLERLTRGRMPA